MRGKPLLVVAAFTLSLSAVAVPAHADEIRLKDGTKITGTIVGFESDSFRVETTYGFALIRKDVVADISISAPKKEPEPGAKSNAPAAPVGTPPAQSSSKSSAAAPNVFPTVTRETVPPANVSPDTDGVLQPAPAKAKPVSPTNASVATTGAPAAAATPSGSSGAHSAAAKAEPSVAKAKPASVAGATSAPSPAPAIANTSASSAKTEASPAVAAVPPTPPAPAEPPVIRDEIRGNQYVNMTYGFQIYRPPSWDLIPAARKSLPGAVAALGTSDHTTMLVIGRDRAKDSLDAHAAATVKALGEAYDNYRVISSKRVSIAGLPAVEQRSRGSADGHDWSVTLLTLFSGNDAYTLLGMTWAESDLIQVQENVIGKAVNSFTFTAK